MAHPKVIIVGTVPYSQMSTSRAFDAYFHNWEKENLVQVFSNAKTPCKGHCSELYQITDHNLLKRWISASETVGRVYYYNKLPKTWDNASLEVGKKTGIAYKLGGKHTPFTHLARKILWQKVLF